MFHISFVNEGLNFLLCFDQKNIHTDKSMDTSLPGGATNVCQIGPFLVVIFNNNYYQTK